MVGSNAGTPTFTFFGKADLGLSTWSYDHANEVTHRELIGAKSEVLIAGRAPTGSVTIDAPKYSALNLPKTTKDGTTGALKIAHGKDEGKIVEINAPKVQLSSVSYAEDNGVMQAQVNMSFLPNAAAGNDEIKFTTK